MAAFETPLMRVGKLIRWQVFEPLIQNAVTRPAKGPGGRPRFDPMLMFKALVLQRLHGLADDATSFQITDRNRFASRLRNRAFLGLTPADLVPDGQTIADFREELIATKTFESLYEVFLEHLKKEHGLVLAKEGVMVDASFDVAAAPPLRGSLTAVCLAPLGCRSAQAAQQPRRQRVDQSRRCAAVIAGQRQAPGA